MSDETRMTLLHSSTNDLVEELLMWKSLAAEYLDRVTKLEAENIRLGIEYQRMRLALGDIAINCKRALNESPTDQLTARWRQERQDDKWIPVSERLPETDGQYIGYTNTGLVGTHWLVDGHFVVTYSCEQNWLTTPTSWILESASGGDVYVTHWMPLPESPNDTQTQTIVYGKESEK